jgi:histidyl-tRNA synthetase
MIMMLSELYDSLGVPEVDLRLGSMGCSQCRPVYQESLKTFLEQRWDSLCEDCHERTGLNPLRVFDCKQEGCREQLGEAPLLVDNLCQSCREKFETLKGYLESMGRQYRMDGTLVRGFDYYTGTTFEYECASLGAQKGIGGGGRYDGLVEELGGPAAAAIGFGTGMERIVLALQSAGITATDSGIDVFFMVLDAAARGEAVKVIDRLRRSGISVDTDYAGRKPKGQMKQANRLGARITVIIGEDELKAGAAAVKDMTSGKQEDVDFNELVTYIKDRFGAGNE